jgi:signal peptidase I
MKAERARPVVPLWRRLLIGRRPGWTMARAAAMAVTAFVVFNYVLWPIRICGESMLPAYHDGRVNFINRLAYRKHPPRRGDVVGVMTTGRHIMYLKRIVGLPKDTVSIEHGVVLIDGRPLDEPYVKYRAAWELEPHYLAPDEYLVIGDNRGMDQQTHSFGVIKAGKIAGKTLW